ncbi:type II CRISPR-associated endonuclease Cas1 [Fulvivirgaceae bacterium BMA10]|uniref:CRISPR-associated endonuclease Cas1 n=1 Tax=Splendidivirga corallicola TaxID=3051826 RepID=A0ABT8KVX0_9BACT|nr:type II CRISPR-associated endonuclease Cas1 [Fulvivirgaceae bacterium BMA10]
MKNKQNTNTMIKRTIYISNEAHLSTKNRQLLVAYPGEKEAKKVAVEDIGILVLDHYSITLSHTLLSRLLENNAAVITCSSNHMPQGMLLNLEGHSVQQERFRHQISVSEPLKKQLWQQTIKAKIGNQAALLGKTGVAVDNMYYWQKQVRSGDTENLEGRASAYYWKHLFAHERDGFKRGRFEEEPNNLLNYGYAILRATVARSLVASGLLPTLGIHHHNRYNAYCLADDIMEPYRPYVDYLVLEIIDDTPEYQELTTALKARLLQLPARDVRINEQQAPLMNAVALTTSSLYDCFAGKRKKLLYPEL